MEHPERVEDILPGFSVWLREVVVGNARGEAFDCRGQYWWRCGKPRGRRYGNRSRGPLWMNGRGNYTTIGTAIGVGLVSDPELVSMPSVGFSAAVKFWNSKSLNADCVSGSASEFMRVTLKLTGGYGGLADRQARFASIRQGLVC